MMGVGISTGRRGSQLVSPDNLHGSHPSSPRTGQPYMWHSPPAIHHTRLRVRRPGIGSALPASDATKCYVFPLFREFGKPGFRRKMLLDRWLWLVVPGDLFDNN